MAGKFYFTLGRPFPPLYGWIMRLRAQLYEKGVLNSTSFAVPVISIGNLTLGGTGKTPMVQHFVRLLQKKGYRPAIISRGYGGSTKERINIVSDGKDLFLDAAYAGDEPRMLAETLPGVPVLTGIVRKLPAAKAVEMGADILLLDDGFQHLPIRRDFDLVLFNADTLAGNSRVFPGGDLREPVRALERCHAFGLTGADEHNRERAVQFACLLRKKFPGKPVFFSGYNPDGIICQGKEGRTRQVERQELAERRCFAFCGIARPAGFKETLSRITIEPAAFKAFRDHHSYTEKMVKQLTAEAEKVGADALLTTEKDLVKLHDSAVNLPVYAITMKASPDSALDRLVLKYAGEK